MIDCPEHNEAKARMMDGENTFQDQASYIDRELAKNQPETWREEVVEGTDIPITISNITTTDFKRKWWIWRDYNET